MKVVNFLRKVKKMICTESEDQHSEVNMGTNVDIINSYIDSGFGWLITIGNNVTITNATILAHDASTKKSLGYTKVGRVDIGDNVFIGYGAIVLPNTRIGNNVIIGAGCVVAKDIPENSVVIGNPCHVLCSYDEYLTKNKEQLMKGPVFHKAFSEKTKAEKQEEFDLLSTFSGGYDL
ncbi:MAG TPA: acyltransferase [Candidatus Scubalenecus merdavium]|uniref:Acyltransferase n=1 Tax=Candidatus Scybalenecus merdavium TaxID=2840939 RepID=A0A9D1MTA9_9FIRM|nr:acyltransferase [Candidatus Scubalenecus merdavium]